MLAVRQRYERHSTVKDFFAGRSIVVATMHGKQRVIQPLLKQYLNIERVIVPNFDTDQFGTFSGEIERTFDAVITLRNKILQGLKVTGETLGIGNEGSFGAHPRAPVLHADQELVMLIDLEHKIEIVESLISTETMHDQKVIQCADDLISFAESIEFPKHGIVMKQIDHEKVLALTKGIVSWKSLHEVFNTYSSSRATVMVETDMRAHMNPTRMNVIARATELLMMKVSALCPNCQWPGFGVVEVKSGLICRQCRVPTDLPLLDIYRCLKCGFADEMQAGNGKLADPQYCDNCNP